MIDSFCLIKYRRISYSTALSVIDTLYFVIRYVLKVVILRERSIYIYMYAKIIS